MNIQDKLPLLKRILSYINTNEVRTQTSVYISPAQTLRNRADFLEQQEQDFYELEKMINEIEKNKNLTNN